MSTEIIVHKPTKLLIEKNDKNELTRGRIEHATLAWVKLQEGELAFGSETEKDYSVTTIVTEQTAKDFKSVFPKNNFRAIPTAEFEGKFRIPAPYPEQSDQYTIKLKASTTYSTDIPALNATAGQLVPYEQKSRPKLFEFRDGKPVDITMEIAPANGSKGVVAFKVTTNKYGTFPTLTGVALTELIEYQAKASFEDEFGNEAETKRLNPVSTPELNAPTPHEDANSEADWF